MMYMNGNEQYRAQDPGPPPAIATTREEGSAMAIVGWTSVAAVAVGIAAVGLYLGRELRARYKFNHRTQYDFFSHAGDSVCAADYGTGI
jgi:hypothetical protein